MPCIIVVMHWFFNINRNSAQSVYYLFNGFIMNKDEWMTSHVDVCGEEFSKIVIIC